MNPGDEPEGVRFRTAQAVLLERERAAARAAATPPQGIAIGKFQGGTTAITPFGRAASVGICRHMRAVSR